MRSVDIHARIAGARGAQARRWHRPAYPTATLSEDACLFHLGWNRGVYAQDGVDDARPHVEVLLVIWQSRATSLLGEVLGRLRRTLGLVQYFRQRLVQRILLIEHGFDDTNESLACQYIANSYHWCLNMQHALATCAATLMVRALAALTTPDERGLPGQAKRAKSLHKQVSLLVQASLVEYLNHDAE